MRPRSRLPRFLAGVVVAATALVGLSATPGLAVPVHAHAPIHAPVSDFAAGAASQGHGPAGPGRLLPPTGAPTDGTPDQAAVQTRRLSATELPPRAPLTPPKGQPRSGPARRTATTTSCTPADFSGRTGSELVSFIEGATTDCVDTLFSLTGADASGVFPESRMTAVADALRAASATYPGDDSTGVLQLVLFLRAGYYVQFNDPADVGGYDAVLTDAVASGIDAFTASPHFTDVSDANGRIAGEVVVLTDSAGLQARYLGLYQRILNGYSSAYDASWYMTNFVNDVFTPLYRGHQYPDFVSAVTADPGIIHTLDAFALNHLGLLGTGQSFLDSNAGVETARFVEHPALRSTVRPLVKGLLDASSITGPTAPLWVGVANLASAEDQAQCSYYGVCDLTGQLSAAALPISHTCDSTHTIRAQALTAADLAAVCSSLQNQDPFFHRLVGDNGPVPGQYESSEQVVVFAGPTDYQTYAGPLYGVSTDNGGITLIGDPTDPADQPVSLMYQKPTDDGFTARIWNLNHEYTHALDARYDMKGDFSQQVSVPDVWWIEGVAEYVSYTYRGVTDTQAVSEAAKHTYTLSTLFENTYENSDVVRTYPWGYLAARYMLEKHPADVAHMLARFRMGDYAGGYAVYHSVGTAYDADFDGWLTACAAGACAAGGTPCTAADPRAMGQNCARAEQSEPQGETDYFYIWLPAGTTNLTVTAGGGTGTAYLLYAPDSWATPDHYTTGSFGDGTAQTLTVSTSTAGYRYVSLYAETAFSGVTVTTRY